MKDCGAGRWLDKYPTSHNSSNLFDELLQVPSMSLHKDSSPDFNHESRVLVSRKPTMVVSVMDVVDNVCGYALNKIWTYSYRSCLTTLIGFVL